MGQDLNTLPAVAVHIPMGAALRQADFLVIDDVDGRQLLTMQRGIECVLAAQHDSGRAGSRCKWLRLALNRLDRFGNAAGSLPALTYICCADTK